MTYKYKILELKTIRHNPRPTIHTPAQICPGSLHVMMVDAIVELTEPQAAGDITESHAKMRLVIEKLAAAGVFKSLALLLKINSSASDLRQENHRQKYEEIVWMPAAAESISAAASRQVPKKLYVDAAITATVPVVFQR